MSFITSSGEARSVATMALRWPGIAYLLLLLLFPVRLAAAAQGQFNNDIDNGEVIIVGYTGAGGDIIIPSTIEGLPVTSIWAEAFRGLASVTSVTIPDTVITIRPAAFGDCPALISVVLGKAVASIADDAFAG